MLSELEADKPADEMAGSSTTFEDVKFVERVLEVTRCRDRRLVSEICAEAGYFDVDLVCSHVLAFMEGVRSSSSSTTSDGDSELSINSTASSVTSSAAAGAKPKSRTAGRQRKQEKKARAMQRHRVNAMTVAAAGTSDAAGCHGRLGSSDEDDSVPFVITQQLKVLQI